MTDKITRKYDFIPRTPAKADEVDAEFNQLVDTVNSIIDDTVAGDTKVGDQLYTEDNYVTDGETATESIDALDIQVKDNVDSIVANASDIDDLETAGGVQDTAIGLNTSKVTYPSADSAKLAGIEASADVNNISDVNATALTGGGETALHSHAGGAGAVDSVNEKTGVVVLDPDDLVDTATTNKFVTATDITNLGNLSGTNTGDQTKITENLTLNAANISNKYIDLANIPLDNTAVGLFPVGGVKQLYTTDFTVITDGADVLRLNWNGLGLESLLSENDIISADYIY